LLDGTERSILLFQSLLCADFEEGEDTQNYHKRKEKSYFSVLSEFFPKIGRKQKI
jgi:hypothetical protein